jgi:hypothetical protein
MPLIVGCKLKLIFNKMKKSNKLMILLVLILFLTCTENKEEKTVCGVKDPLKDLPWLNEIITLSKSDTTGFYIGTIWLTEYHGQELFVTDMSLGSGAIAYAVFNCNGDIVPIDDLDFYNSLSEDDIIYSNMPIR